MDCILLVVPGCAPRLLSEKLRYLRQQSGMTQGAVAQQLLLASYTHITKIEAGQRAASLTLIIRMAHLFGVPTDYLLRDTVPITRVTVASTPRLHAQEQPMPLHHFGSTLRHLRVQYGISQTDLARRLGLARQAYISNLEAGRKEPSPNIVVQVADIFGVTTDYLLRTPPDAANTPIEATE